MNRWSALLLALVALLALGFPVGNARKMVVLRRSGDSFHGWPTLMKVLDIHKHFDQGLHFVKSNEWLPEHELQWLERNLHRSFIRGISKSKEQVPDYELRSLERNLRRSSVRGVPESFLCDTCMDISTFMEQVLTDPDTMNSFLEYVNGSVCKNLPGFQSKCLDLANLYIPSLVETLQIYAAPNKLCGETKLCPSSAMLLINDAKACKMCTEFATEALAYVQDNATETQVVEAFHTQCAKLGDFSSRCNSLVDTYAPMFLSKLDSTTPDEICEKVGFCSCQSMKDASSCATCEFAVFQMKAKLRNPQVQEKMLETLLDQCSKVPSYTDQCKEIVDLYAPNILANLDTYLNAETICTEIHACESRKKLADDILIQLPSSNDGVAHM